MSIPPVLRRILLPLGLIGLFAAMWFGLYRPEMDKIAEYRNAPLATRHQIDQMTRQLSAYERPTDAERAEWETLEQEIRRKIPRGRDITSLYASISELVVKYSLTDFQRNLLDEAAESAVTTTDGIPRRSFGIELTFESGYAELIGFIRDIRDLDRLVEVTMLDVTRGVPNLSVRMSIKCYYAPES